MTIRIVTDSVSDLPPEVAADLEIEVIPDFINVGETSYRDGVDITRQEFYQRLPGWNPPPTTAAPGVGTFQAVYERLARQGASAILSLHVYDKLSNLANTARLAAEATHTIPVKVVTGGFVSLSGGFAAAAAARAAQAGRSLNEIISLVHELTERTFIFAGLDTLEYLRRSGRVSHLRARLGSWLHILPVLKMHQEEISMELVRTKAHALARVIELVQELGPLEEVGIVHANIPERARALREKIAGFIPASKEPWIVDITPVIGVHVGPAALGLVAVRAR